MPRPSRLIPLIVASPVFLQNIDGSAMATALPSMAASLHVPALNLNLVITAYLLSLAVFLPMSAWLADRFGARRMFCAAIVLFSLASALCGFAGSLASLVAWRVLQGLGAAMMVPVGRLILLRSVPPSEMIAAMVWYTVPPVVGRLAGPLVGGGIVSVASWHWIFFVNIPLGVAAIALTLLFVERTPPEHAGAAFDFSGFFLMAVGLGALLAALETVGKGLVAGWVCGLAALVGIGALAGYGLLSRQRANPVIDLGILRLRTFRTAVIGGAPLRMALFGMPFLLPLLFQLGFGLAPLTSGMLSAGSALGALCTRAALRQALLRLGFRRLLLGGTGLTGLAYASYALFGPSTSHALIFFTLFGGGLLGSSCMVSLNTLGFVEVPKERMSHATALSSMAQQLTSAGGVVLAASLLTLFSWWRGGSGHHLIWQDFGATFLMLGLTTMLSIVSLRKLTPEDGRELG